MRVHHYWALVGTWIVVLTTMAYSSVLTWAVMASIAARAERSVLLPNGAQRGIAFPNASALANVASISSVTRNMLFQPLEGVMRSSANTIWIVARYLHTVALGGAAI